MQRDKHASSEELVNLVTGFVRPDSRRAWLGYVRMPVGALRAIEIDEKPQRPFCIYDAAEKEYPGHAEIALGYEIEEADEIEFRRHLMRVCEDGVVHDRRLLRDGAVWERLPEDVRNRELPVQWAHLA